MTMKERIKAEAYDDKQGAEMYSLLQKYETEYPVDITGDACEGDEVVFLRAVLEAPKRIPNFCATSELFFSNKPIYKVLGWLVEGKLGSDGEPLVVPCEA